VVFINFLSILQNGNLIDTRMYRIPKPIYPCNTLKPHLNGQGQR